MAPPGIPGRRRRDLTGLRTVVTGGSSGVGRAVALELAGRGAAVLATARRLERLERLAAEAGGGTRVVVEAGDVCDPAFRSHLAAAARARLGGLDCLVAAAGGGAIGRFRDAAPQTLSRLLDLDLVAPLELVRCCLPQLALGRQPGIVLVGSILGLHPLPLHGEYCAAKAGLRAAAGALRLELAADGIDVMHVALGPVASEFWESLVAGSRPSWSRGRAMPADRAARAIVDGLVSRAAEVTPGWRALGYAWAARHAPGLIDMVARRWLRDERRDATAR